MCLALLTAFDGNAIRILRGGCYAAGVAAYVLMRCRGFLIIEFRKIATCRPERDEFAPELCCKNCSVCRFYSWNTPSVSPGVRCYVAGIAVFALTDKQVSLFGTD